MSIAFSNTTSKNGLIQIIERKCGFRDGDITGNTTLFAQFTSDINNAYDELVVLLLKSSGWQWDDSNQTDYPIITTNLVANQRDYTFTTDGAGNSILEVYKVFVANSSSVFSEMYPVDVETGTNNPLSPYAPSGSLYAGSGLSTFTDGRNSTGVPIRYDKLANGIFLDPIPSYSLSGGLKMYVSREGSYFTVADTTKKAGFAGIFHELLALIPAWKYAVDNNLTNANGLLAQITVKKRDMQDYYSKRERDVKPRLQANIESTK